MNLFRPQKPYVFHSPRYTPWLAPLLQRISERMLRKQFKVREICVEGEDKLMDLANQGHSLLVAPNHSDHADPHVLCCVGRQCGLIFHFMAAREGFEKSRVHAFVLQRSGAFSVDREGNDIASIKTALRILQEGRYPLVMFPEGEIWHHHEQLDILNEGVATIALRASSKIKNDRKCYMIPTAIRYAYDQNFERTFSERLARLEKRITWKPCPELEVVDRIYRLGSGLIAIKEVEYLGHGQSGSLVERIANLQNKLVEMIEAKHGRAKDAATIPERVKELRGKIRRILTDQEVRLSREEQESLYDDLDKLFAAIQLYSYPGQYLREQPTIHRIAETLLKIEEDVLEKAEYPCARDVHVGFSNPIDVARFIEHRSLNIKSGVTPLTHYLHEQIQTRLEQICENR